MQDRLDRAAATRSAAVILALVLAVPTASLAIAPTSPSGSPLQGLGEPVVSKFMMNVGPSLEIHRMGSPSIGEIDRLQPFLERYSDRWEVRWDRRSDRPHLLQGAGVPIIPGAGNSLTRADVGVASDARVELADLERLLRGFMAEHAGLLGVDPASLRLDTRASGPYGADDYFWNVEFQQVVGGVPVHGAKVFFRVNHGNIVQLGTENLADVAVSTDPRFDRAEARGFVLGSVGLDRADVSEIVEPGRLVVFPTLTSGEEPGHLYAGTAGQGYDHRLVWEIVFRRHGDQGTYRARVDALSGEILELLDINKYAAATVEGGIYPETNTDPEETRPFPFADVSNNGAKTTDANGIYDYDGGTATVELDGKFTNINDNCGNISLSDSTDGNIDFGTSGGDDCTTPGFGGAGNTHSARTGFYHLTQVNRDAVAFLAGNGWLAGTLTANMNINNTCNAFWNGSTVNFYRSGGGCSNTGEINDVFIHEWGHGLDQNTNGSPPENGSGEAYADTFAFIYNGNSCIGENFTPGNPCHNCGSCTGVRDMGPFSQGGGASIASPANVEANGGINCDRFACPFFGYLGPMGYEGHCESYIASAANWDMRSGVGAGVFESIWYGSLNSTQSAYRLVSGGQCNPSADVDGCGGSNWYTVYLAVDDDDGDMSNGTPHCGEIYDAFDAHGIACGDRCDDSGEEICDNGTDDDGDGMIDCDDPDCADDPVCTSPEDCSNGVDDDGDGMIDCDDPDCLGDPACDEPCNLGLRVDDAVRAGDSLRWEVGLEHNRQLAVDASFRMWIEDAFGNFVVGSESVVHTFEYGDRVQLRGSVPVPADQAPGDYVMIVAIGEMQQGVARRERSFVVLE